MTHSQPVRRDDPGGATIFVMVPSYRDTETQWTIQDLFDKAARPDRVFVGVCWQFDPEQDAHCFEVETRPEQVRTVEFHIRDAAGACFARHHAQQLWRGETHTLHIDAHMRFVPGWDELMLEMLAACPSPKPILSTYPAAYRPPTALRPPTVTRLRVHRMDRTWLLKNWMVHYPLGDEPDAPIPSGLVAAGYVFGRSEFTKDVPYDPHLYVAGEELGLAVRLYTHGWDVYAPHRHAIWHYYTEKEDHDGQSRHWHWKEATITGAQRRSLERTRYMLLGGSKPADPLVTRDLSAYTIGSERTVAQFEQRMGIDFTAGTFSAMAASGRFPPYRSARTRSLAARLDVAPPPPTRGRASTAAVDRSSPLAQLLARQGVRTLVDVGCGDTTWLDPITAELDWYVGLDIAERVLERNRHRLRARATHFFAFSDLREMTPPKSDALLCIDVLGAVGRTEGVEILRRLAQSGSKMLWASLPLLPSASRFAPHAAPGTTPVVIPPPLEVVNVGRSKGVTRIGVWSVEDIGRAVGVSPARRSRLSEAPEAAVPSRLPPA